MSALPVTPTEDIAAVMADMGRCARASADALRLAGAETRTAALTAIAAAIRSRANAILAANHSDIVRARTNGVSEALIDRLALTPARIEAVAVAVDEIAALPDPLGVETARWTRPNGLDMARVRTPLGVLAIIFGGVGMARAAAGEATNRSSAVAGLVMGIIALVLSILFWVWFFQTWTPYD